MNEQFGHLQVEVELLPGEKLSLPSSLVESVGVGLKLITVEPANGSSPAVRGHGAFLAGYAPSDESFYDDAGR